MSPRVVVDATCLLYPKSGIGRLTRALVEELCRRQHDLELVLFGRRLMGPSLASLIPGVETVHLRLPRAAETGIRKTDLVARLCRGDLYHATDFYLPLKKPETAVATVHDVIFLTHPEPMVDHRRLARWSPDFARRCRQVITISQHSKQEICTHLAIEPERVEVIYPGVDSRCFRPADDTLALRGRLRRILAFDRPYFLSVSCSTGRKNTPMLLDAYLQLLGGRTENDLVLTWAPPEAVRRRWKDGIRKGRIHFIGRQKDADLCDLYRGATALIFPSRYEGFGMPILEAMSCGTPVITSNATATVEIGGEVAHYVDPEDRQSLVAAMELFEKGHTGRPSPDPGCLRHAAAFTWERCARRTLALYERSLCG